MTLKKYLVLLFVFVFFTNHAQQGKTEIEEIKNNTAISFRSETLGDGVLTWEELRSKTN